jgi:lipopolysaccharide transport system ATP-binding protein
LRLADFRAKNMREIINHVSIVDDSGNQTANILAGSPLTIQIDYDSPVPLHQPVLGCIVETSMGERLFFLQTMLQYGRLKSLPQKGVACCHVPELPLSPGRYYLTIGLSSHDRQLDRLERAVVLDVQPADFYGTGNLPSPRHGRFLVRAHWRFSD